MTVGLKDYTKVYECDRRKCGENCCGKCHLTTDVNHAADPEKYIKAGDLITKNHQGGTDYVKQDN